jgi:peptidoglycan/LPS O-acetylase OafA/YrhL
MHKNSQLAIYGMLVAAVIFSLDLMFPTHGIIAAFYIILILISLLSTETMLTVWASLIASVLISFGIYYNGGFSMQINELFNRIFAYVIILLTAILSIQRKEVEKELMDLNLNLELKVLARTAASENRSIRLEKQILVLQNLRNDDKLIAFKELDDVIHSLKELTHEETIEVSEYING